MSCQYWLKKALNIPPNTMLLMFIKAKPDLANFYQQLDPTKSLNSGIGKVNKLKFYE